MMISRLRDGGDAEAAEAALEYVPGDFDDIFFEP